MAFEVSLTTDSKKPENLTQSENVSFADLGEFSSLGQYIMECPDAKLTMKSKLFLKDLLKLTGLEMSFGVMEPNNKWPFAHRHKNNEELYLVLSGNGVMEADGKEYDLKEGSVMRVAPAAVIRLSSGDRGLTYICIQTRKDSLEGYTMTDAEIL